MTINPGIWKRFSILRQFRAAYPPEAGYPEGVREIGKHFFLCLAYHAIGTASPQPTGSAGSPGSLKTNALFNSSALCVG